MAKKRRKALETFSERLGVRLADVREARGWTQETLAARVDVGFSHLAKLETGVRRPSLDLLFRLAQALDVDTWELLCFDGQPQDWRGPDTEQEWLRFRRLLGDAPNKDIRLLRSIAEKIWRK